MDKDIEYLKKYLAEDKLEEGLKLLEKGLPVQYIIGNVDFYGNIIKVNEHTLIPRFETELLVEKTIHYIKQKFKNPSSIEVLDIGTGSGAIAITLNKELKCLVDASDISKEALEVAITNNKENQTSVNFIYSDIFLSIDKKYDVIISNPPYIAYDEEIMKVVYNNEPHTALFAPNNGLYFYDKILQECHRYLKEDYLIAFEIGYKQKEDIESLAHKYLQNINIVCEKDYNDRDRFIFITNKKD